MKFNNDNIRTAVQLYLQNKTEATRLYGHINNWDVSNVTDMKNLFYRAISFNQPLNRWDVSNVTNMEGMFTSAKSFNQPLPEWSLSSV